MIFWGKKRTRDVVDVESLEYNRKGLIYTLGNMAIISMTAIILLFCLFNMTTKLWIPIGANLLDLVVMAIVGYAHFDRLLFYFPFFVSLFNLIQTIIEIMYIQSPNLLTLIKS